MKKIKCFKKQERDAVDWYYAEIDTANKTIEWVCETGYPIGISAEDKSKYASALDMQMYGVTISKGRQTFEEFLNCPQFDLNMETYERIVMEMNS